MRRRRDEKDDDGQGQGKSWPRKRLRLTDCPKTDPSLGNSDSVQSRAVQVDPSHGSGQAGQGRLVGYTPTEITAVRSWELKWRERCTALVIDTMGTAQTPLLSILRAPVRDVLTQTACDFLWRFFRCLLDPVVIGLLDASPGRVSEERYPDSLLRCHPLPIPDLYDFHAALHMPDLKLPDIRFQECAHPWTAVPQKIVDATFAIITGVELDADASRHIDNGQQRCEFERKLKLFLAETRTTYELSVLTPLLFRGVYNFVPCKDVATIISLYALDAQDCASKRRAARQMIQRSSSMREFIKACPSLNVENLELAIWCLHAWLADLFKQWDDANLFTPHTVCSFDDNDDRDMPDPWSFEPGTEALRRKLLKLGEAQEEAAWTIFLKWQSGQPEELRLRVLRTQISVLADDHNRLRWQKLIDWLDCVRYPCLAYSSKIDHAILRLLHYGHAKERLVVFEADGTLLKDDHGGGSLKDNLDLLKDCGCQMTVVSHRPHYDINTMLNSMDLTDYFLNERSWAPTIPDTGSDTVSVAAEADSDTLKRTLHAVQNDFGIPFQDWVLFSARPKLLDAARCLGVPVHRVDPSKGVTRSDLQLAGLTTDPELLLNT